MGDGADLEKNRAGLALKTQLAASCRELLDFAALLSTATPLEITEKKRYWYLIAGINSMMCETYSSFLKRFRIFSHHTFLSACFYRSKLPASEEVSWNFQDFQATGTIWIDPKTSFMADDFFWCFFPGRNDDLNFGDFQSFVYRFDSFQDLGHSLQTLLSWSVGMFFFGKLMTSSKQNGTFSPCLGFLFWIIPKSNAAKSGLVLVQLLILRARSVFFSRPRNTYLRVPLRGLRHEKFHSSVFNFGMKYTPEN